MGKKRSRRLSSQSWFWDYGKYVGLVVLAAVTVGLVALAFNPPVTSQASPRTPQVATTPSVEPEAPKRVAFLGDSYTQGVGASSPELGFPTVLASKQGWTAEILGCGGSGYMNPGPYCKVPYVDRITAVAATNPDIVIVSGGRNDRSYLSNAEFEATVNRTFATLREQLPDARIIAVSPLWDDDPAPAEIETIGNLVRGAAEAAGGTYVEVSQPLAGRPEFLSTDGVHPNDAGYAAIAEAIGTLVTP